MKGDINLLRNCTVSQLIIGRLGGVSGQHSVRVARTCTPVAAVATAAAERGA